MQIVRKVDGTPRNSLIINDFEKFDYCDSFLISKKTVDTVDAITTSLFILPWWVNLLMGIRNAVVKVFGLKTGDIEDTSINSHYDIGSRAVYFTVIDRNDNEIVMSENDRHLNFRTSVLIERSGVNSSIYLTTMVKFNNIWGRLYFILVKPFHRIIIKSLLKRLNHE